MIVSKSIVSVQRRHKEEVLVDCTVSFVLFHTPIEEVSQVVASVCAAKASVHVWLVDNSVPPIALPDFPANVSVIKTGENLGYGRAHNVAIRAAAGLARYHFILNTDLEFDGDAIDGMTAFLDLNPQAGLAMPKVVYPDGQIQRLCRLLPDPVGLIARRFLGKTAWGRARNERYEFHHWHYDTVASFPFLSGCFMAVRRSVLDQVGGFDERYFMYAEDIDLSRRIHAVSQTLFVPTVKVQHEYRSHTRRSLRLLSYLVINFARYFNKWGWFRDPERDRVNAETIRRLQAHSAVEATLQV